MAEPAGVPLWRRIEESVTLAANRIHNKHSRYRNAWTLIFASLTGTGEGWGEGKRRRGGRGKEGEGDGDYREGRGEKRREKEIE